MRVRICTARVRGQAQVWLQCCCHLHYTGFFTTQKFIRCCFTEGADWLQKTAKGSLIAVRQGSKKHATDFRHFSVFIVQLQLILSVNLSYCNRVLWHTEKNHISITVEGENRNTS